jgi:hypothetical protein
MRCVIVIMDVAPDPVSIGAVVAVIFFVLGFIGLLAVALVVFLWYRKRGTRGVEMSRPASLPTITDVQPSNPNQP